MYLPKIWRQWRPCGFVVQVVCRVCLEKDAILQQEISPLVTRTTEQKKSCDEFSFY